MVNIYNHIIRIHIHNHNPIRGGRWWWWQFRSVRPACLSGRRIVVGCHSALDLLKRVLIKSLIRKRFHHKISSARSGKLGTLCSCRQIGFELAVPNWIWKLGLNDNFQLRVQITFVRVGNFVYFLLHPREDMDWDDAGTHGTNSSVPYYL